MFLRFPRLEGCGFAPMIDAAPTLLVIKCTTAVGGATALGAAALLQLRPLSFRSLVPSAALLSLALVVLSRGAPHNNPAFFSIYDAYGFAGILAVGAAMMIAAAGIAAAYRTAPFNPSCKTTALLVAALTVLAVLAAAEPVVRYWNAPPWGDSIFYDRIAVSIARGTEPAGHSYYMPIYQYGPAAFYWAFGHFFFVQQTINVLFAALTVPLLALSAWNFFRSNAAVLLVALVATTTDQFRHAPIILQIENWYVPDLCFSIWAASCYFRRATTRTALLLGVAAALIFEMRTQAGFYVGWLVIAPLLLRTTSPIMRLKHMALAIAVIVTFAVPWTIRNVIVDGRISPIGAQAGQRIVSTNASEIDFFGIRRDLLTNLPPSVTPTAPVSTFKRLLGMVEDPVTFVRSGWWRGLAFYGLVPPGIWDPAGPRDTHLSEWPSYLLRTAPILVLFFADALGLLFRPGRATLFLLGAIGANLAVVFFAGFSEPRISYPVLALHVLLAAAAVFRPQLEFAQGPAQTTATPVVVRRLLPLALCIAVVVLAMSHWLMGRHFVYPPQTDAALMRIGPVNIDRSLPDLNALTPNDWRAPTPLRAGMRARFTGVVSNAMEPVKWYAFPLAGFPDYTADPSRESYFRAYLLDPSGTFRWGDSRPVGLTVAGATIDRPLREDEGIEVEGEICDVSNRGIFWFRAEKIRHLNGASGAFERFL